MKVLQVINSLATGGAEKLILDSIPLYQEKGIEVDVLSLKNDITPFWTELGKKTNGSVFGLTSKSVYNPILIFRIIPYLKKYDLIHIHLFPSLYWVVFAKLISFSKVTLIYTEHSTSNRRRSLLLFKWLDKFVYKKLKCIVTIADEVDLNIKKHLNIQNSNYRKIYNGVATQVFDTAIPYAKTLFVTEKDILIIQVSSFRWQKDQNTLIKSLSFLEHNYKLLLVGVGPLLEESKALVNQLGLESRVQFLGNRNDVPKLLKTVDIVVLSSNHEGLSLSNIEGMAAGKPFIGSNVPGITEIVEGHGILFENGNAEELSIIIKKLMLDKEYSTKIAKQCQERAKDFDIEIMVNQYIKLYQEVYA